MQNADTKVGYISNQQILINYYINLQITHYTFKGLVKSQIIRFLSICTNDIHEVCHTLFTAFRKKDMPIAFKEKKSNDTLYSLHSHGQIVAQDPDAKRANTLQ